ncbi:hypothetical protein QJU37_10085, partial [Pasteurella atlantica]
TSGLNHYFYVGSDSKILHSSSSFDDISKILLRKNNTHSYYNKYYVKSDGYLVNYIKDDLSIENQEIIGTQQSDLFIHHKGYSSVFDGQNGTDTVYADLSGWTQAVTIKDGAADIKQAEGNSLKFTNMERLLLKTGSGNDVIDNSKNSTNDYIDTGAGNDKINTGKGNDIIQAGTGNDEIIVSTLGDATNTLSGGAGIDTLHLDYSKNPVNYYYTSGLNHYFYVGSDSKILHSSSSFDDISKILLRKNNTHSYYNKYYVKSDGYLVNYIKDDLSIENQEIIGTQQSDLFIHHKGYSSVFDGQNGTDTVYADLSDWKTGITIINNK